MEEKKQIKIRLSTAICIFIIIILLLVIAGMYYYNYTPKNNDNNNTVVAENNSKITNEINNSTSRQTEKEYNNQKSENVLENWPNIDTSKIVNPGNGYIYSQKCMEGNSYTISKDKRSITLDYTNKKISGFKKNIESACIHFVGQGSLEFYAFLYEDGTVGYTTQNDNGKIKDFSGLSGIIKISALDYTRKVEWDNGKLVDFPESTIIAIDNNGKIYDLGLLR